MWSPFVFPQSFHDHKQIGRFLTVAARLKPGVTHAQAQAEMTPSPPARTRVSRFRRHWGINVVPLRQQISGELRPALLILFGAVAFVLLIACAMFPACFSPARPAANVRWPFEPPSAQAAGASRVNC